MNTTICYRPEGVGFEADEDDDSVLMGKCMYREGAETDNGFGLGRATGVDGRNSRTDGARIDRHILVIHSLTHQLATAISFL